MKINLNGAPEETEEPTLMALVKSRNLDPSSLIIECNSKIFKQDTWGHTPIREGDTIELLNFVGGG